MMADHTYPANWQAIRREVLLRADYRCESCGLVFGGDCRALDTRILDKHGKLPVLTVHHIDGNKSHNLPCNLVSLCRDCHNIADKWKPGNELVWDYVPTWILTRKLSYRRKGA